MIKLTIDERQVEVEEGKTILEAAESIGIKIPALCYHKALLPHGACRLCVVEISGRPRLAASCAYLVEEGIEVKTASPRILKARKLTMGLLLLRCPDVPKLKELAEEIGVDEEMLKRFRPDGEKCILCGLCARVCREKMKVGAIDFINRGHKRKISPPFGELSPICITCGACEKVCPTGAINLAEITRNKPMPIPSEFDMALRRREAIYIPFPQAVPKVPAIDRNTCLYFQKGVCKTCESFCGPKAINFKQEDEVIDIDVGAIILSPGFEIFDATIKPELGFGRYPNVITSLQFERILSASGPFSGEVLRPSDKKHPKRIAFIQCVGSRDCERDYCSAVCCMYATKEAIMAKEHLGEDLQGDIFFMDIRAFGKGFEQYYERGKKEGINYIRCRISAIKQIPETKNLRVEYLSEDNRKASSEYDLVVLSVGLQPPKDINNISEIFGIKLNKFNFCETSLFKPVESTRDGIFVVGPFTEPKDIPETVMQAGASASKVQSVLKDLRGSLIKPIEYPSQRDIRGEEPRIGVFVCHCGTNIASVVNVPRVVDYAKTIPNVVFAQNSMYICSDDACKNIKDTIKEHNLNRVVVASCTPRTHEPLFRSVLQEAGLNPYLFEMANIRDQCSWVHMHEPEKATKKAKDLVRMAVAKARLLEPLYKGSTPINRSALVIGGGLAGMISALEIADQEFDVYLVEKEKDLGGNLRRIHYLLNGEDPQEELKSLIEKVKQNNKIRLFTCATIEDVEGFIGNFKTKVAVNGAVRQIQHGIVIVATGGAEYKPKEYLYGQDERVITQLELEEKLYKNQLPNNELRNIIMIQCVGSRDDERPYCSRVCCQEAIKNALKIKEISPDTNIYILYRDIRAYGFRESYYTQAREKGMLFIRHPDDKKPDVSKNEGSLQVNVFDDILKKSIVIRADLVVLSAGTVAESTNKTVAQFLKLPLTQDGFFLEAHMKLRPIDFATDGVFLCGLAHSAKSLEESIVQAQAASGRAGTILSKDKIELEANISFVVDENCDGCAYCVDPCPFKAITLIEYMKQGAIKKTVEVNESICKGCGVCMATCPKKGIYVKGFKLDMLLAMVEAALKPV